MKDIKITYRHGKTNIILETYNRKWNSFKILWKRQKYEVMGRNFEFQWKLIKVCCLPLQPFFCYVKSFWIFFQNVFSCSQNIRFQITPPLYFRDIKIKLLSVLRVHFCDKIHHIVIQEPPFVCCKKLKASHSPVNFVLNSHHSENMKCSTLYKCWISKIILSLYK